MDQPSRTAEEDEQMVRLSMASIWHWTQREDCSPQNLSVGCWQTSRIYVMLGQVQNARRYAELSLGYCQGGSIPPFYLGYAYEALARVEMADGNQSMMQAFLQKAHTVAKSITDEEERKLLLDDLATIQS